MYRSQVLRILALALCITVAAAAPAAARPDHAPAAPPKVPEAAPAAAPVMPSAFYLVPRPAAEFLDEQRRLLAALGAAQAASPEQALALLDLAEFRFAHAMAAEGRSMLQPLESAQLAPAFAARLAALQLALCLIDPLRPDPPEAAALLLTPRYAAWPDQPLFLALAAIREAGPTAAAEHLPAAAARLARFPPAVRAAVLPDLLEAAIVGGQWQLARDLAAEFAHHAELRDGTAFHFLLGQAAEAGGDALAALDSYVRAAEGEDLWAHRARVALVELGLATSTLEPGEAVSLLAQERQLWVGDQHARHVLLRLADLQAQAGDTIAALETIAALLDRYPGSTEADLARTEARAMIDSVYAAGAAGELSLAAFLSAHNRIAPGFRYDPAFAAAAEAFANRFRAAGATGIAAEEYGLTHDYLAVSRDLGLAEVADERLDALRLQQAETLIDGGWLDAAAEVLRTGNQSSDPGLADRLNALRARLYAETGAAAEVVATEVFVPSESYLRTKAAAHFDLGNWARAEQAYDQLYGIYGPDIDFADAVNLILASFRNGHREKAVDLARRFPDITDRPEWAEIAASLNETAPDLLPLRRQTAQDRVDRAAEVLDLLRPAAADREDEGDL